MATPRLGYIDVIILQSLVIACLLWAAAHLLRHVRRLRRIAQVQVQLASMEMNPARPALVRAGPRGMRAEPVVVERPRAFTAAAG
jgi:hypothetical protein